MEVKYLRNAIEFHLGFFLLLMNVGRVDEASTHMEKAMSLVEQIPDGITVQTPS